MLKLAIAALTASMILTGAALAQTTNDAGTAADTTKSTGTANAPGTLSMADCESNYKAADKNADGSLDQAEMDAAKATLPSSIPAGTTVSMKDYVTACSTPK
jgi:uncharacterized lipoprotein NlpE involved in copper resistance